MEWTIDATLPALPFYGWQTANRSHVNESSYGSTADQLPLTRTSESSGWMYICDTGSFWQTSFLNVIDPKGWGDSPVCTDAEFELVKKGKADRGLVAPYGTSDYYPDMVRYNILENELLARVSARLNEGFMNDSIPIRIKRNEWYGPGRAAQTWMDMLHGRIADPAVVESNRHADARSRGNEQGILSADVYSSMPTWFVDAARASYYGGWFEQFVHGHVGDVWEYDINSAYPFVIASLPCLHTEGRHNGRYTQGTGNNFPHYSGGGDSARDPYTLVYATISGSDSHIGAMPFRTRTGNILRPNRLRGWYWVHELEASRAAGLVDSYTVSEWCTYHPCDCSPPFNPDDIGIQRMYQLRLQVGKSSPAGKAFKLVYNSAYGKTAQSVGTPKYANPVYASLITAGCRTLILDAIASHPDRSAAVSMVATDGVYFLSRHPSLPLSASVLGAWDETFKPGMTQLMPGVYWDDDTRSRVRLGASPKLKSRGVPARDLARQIDRLDGLFAQAHFALAEGGEYVWPNITFTQAFTMLSAKAALAQGKWDHAGRVEHGSHRTISANPRTKRHTQPYRDDLYGGLVRTTPYIEWDTLDTQPYSKSFGYVDPEADDDAYVDRDGRDSLAYFRDLLNG